MGKNSVSWGDLDLGLIEACMKGQNPFGKINLSLVFGNFPATPNCNLLDLSWDTGNSEIIHNHTLIIFT